MFKQRLVDKRVVTALDLLYNAGKVDMLDQIEKLLTSDTAKLVALNSKLSMTGLDWVNWIKEQLKEQE